MKRTYKKNRESRRSAFETYSSWYDAYESRGLFEEKYSKEEFNKQYEKARMAGLKNPAKAVASSQRQYSRNFERLLTEKWDAEEYETSPYKGRKERLEELKELSEEEIKEKAKLIFDNYVDAFKESGFTDSEAYASARNIFKEEFDS